uniref:Uncharacterized protein n=1 Tax=viral metagenome TaxID=1070528 RepID=A0A6C0EXV6_9ZZZZ
MDSTSAPAPITPITQIFDKVNEIYIRKTYLERYGGSVIFAIFAILLVIFYFIYLNIQNNKEIVKKDWATNKCNPLYMPFAGAIMDPTDMSKTEYTIQNFSECSETILKDILQVALAPLEAASILLAASISILTGISTSLMGAILNFRLNFKTETKKTSSIQSEFAAILTKIITKSRAALSKGEGILATILFIFFSAYKAGASVFHVILFGEAMILLAMFGALIAAWVIWLFLAWLFPPIGWAIAAGYIWVPIGLSVIYVACMIMVLVLVIFTASIIEKTR